MADTPSSNDKNPRLYQGGNAKPLKKKDTRMPITVSTLQKQIADDVIAVLQDDPTIYQRAGWLVQIIQGEPSPVLKGGRPKPRIRALPLASLQERMAHRIRFQLPHQSHDGDGGKESFRPIHPPSWCVRAIHARGQWKGIRRLEALADFPLWLANGRVLTTPGYDAESGVFLNYHGPKIALPPRVSHGQALRALDTLFDLVCDFPFETEAHKIAWLASAMTPMSRFAFSGPVPFFLCDANVPAAGKGKLMNVAARILSGFNFSVAPYPAEKAEWQKTITAYALGGYPWVFFDNLKDRLGDPNLDAVLTNPQWESRVLGGNQIISEPLYLVFYATGNNVTLEGDIGRRTCHIRLCSPLEHPEDRADFVHPDLEGEIDRRRGKLLACLLMLFRAYEQAGRPAVNLLPWGSFEAWSQTVRAPLVWLGCPDPASTFRALQQTADTDTSDMTALAYYWSRIQPGRFGMTCREFLAAVNGGSSYQLSGEDYEGARDLLACMMREVNSRSLGNRLNRCRGRIYGGRRFINLGEQHNAVRWWVETLSANSEALETTPQTTLTPPDDRWS